MKIPALFLLLIGCLVLTSCNKDAAINAFIKDYDSVINDVIKKLDESDVDEAVKIFESKKQSLRDKWESIKYAKSFQISDAVKKKMETVPVESMNKLGEAAEKAMRKYPDNQTKIKKLVTDISNIIRR